MPEFTALNVGKTLHFKVNTARLSNMHDLKVTDCSSFIFSQKHCSFYSYVFNQDTENISLAKTFVSCVAWVLTPCGHVRYTATIRNKQCDSIHNPIYALCYKQFMTYIYISTPTCFGTKMPSSASHYNRRIAYKPWCQCRFSSSS